jgi:radical SAM superfamily enzyme YgiQ (UPF0313 family)
MKVMITYPPLASGKGTPLLSQNRQFQYFRRPTYIYPVVPASAATLLMQKGFEVVWSDAIAEQSSHKQWLDHVRQEKPDLVAMETKTPVVKQHWKIIDDLKRLPTPDSRLLTVLFGDHVTALPEESMQNSQVDFVLTGGDYDFLLLNLCNQLATRNSQLETGLEPGIYYRQNGEIKNSGPFELNHNLDDLPFMDRDLTKWQLYADENGNYKRTPGTYIMSGRDCWWGKCSFCSWPTLYPKFRVRRAENVLDEIGKLIETFGVREIMDDTGTFPVGKWLTEFCNGMKQRGYNKKIYLDCNMRFGALSSGDYKLMKEAGFRLLLFGLESANQNTLNRISKKLKTEEIVESCRNARVAGLYPHITIMFGYPWESCEDAKRTLDLGKWLLKKGYAYTVQATVVIPYPGSPLFEECKRLGLLKTLDWERYDMREPVMKSSVEDREIMKLVQGIYGVAYNPEFICRRIASIRDIQDVKYFARAGAKVMGHLIDFSGRKWL